jgi:hypothetical protein
LTRVSIILRKSVWKKMDCRVKPGNDDLSRFPGAMQRVALREALLRRTGIVTNTVLCTAPALQRTTP